jgi:hypothetical protein
MSKIKLVDARTLYQAKVLLGNKNKIHKKCYCFSSLKLSKKMHTELGEDNCRAPPNLLQIRRTEVNGKHKKISYDRTHPD